MTSVIRRERPFPQEQLKLSHCATRLCLCGLRFRRVVGPSELEQKRRLGAMAQAMRRNLARRATVGGGLFLE